MKHIACIILLVALSFAVKGQISPDLKTGVGYSYALDKDDSQSPNYHTIKGYPTVSIEKPFPVEIRLKKRMSINPGLAYNFFKEERPECFRFIHKFRDGLIQGMYETQKIPEDKAKQILSFMREYNDIF